MASFKSYTILSMVKRRFEQSWMFIAFFIVFFLFWEYAVIWFEIPRYILTPLSLVITEVRLTCIGYSITLMSPASKWS